MSQPSSGQGCFDIVVIDDICRFPLHLWRHLSKNLAFGVGNIQDGQSVFGGGESPRGLATPAGDARIWWVDAGSNSWKKDLRTLQGHVSRPWLFLLDVRGAIPVAGASRPYNVLNAVQDLKRGPWMVDLEGEEGDAPDIVLVSSYEMIPPTGISLPVYAKTSETLEMIENRVRRSTLSGNVGEQESRDARGVQGGAESDYCLHVLVTGAGFEFEESFNASEMRQPGVQATDKLLEKALRRAGDGLTEPPCSENERESSLAPFKVPEALELRPNDPLSRAAWERRLDDYWNELLAAYLRPVLEPSSKGSSLKKVSQEKLRVSKKEQALREAFRQQFLKDDWGYLPQAIQATRFPFTAWLSTNYTRFADRAIDLWRAGSVRSEMSQKTRSSAKEAVMDWEIVSTSNEAAYLIRNFLHEPVKWSRERSLRYLFKLHGDVGHLTTMAIAGHDKDVFSPLSFPVDSLDRVYTAAELYLERAIESFWHRVEGGKARNGCGVLWHVVGHGLKDLLLVNRIARVVNHSQDSNCPHAFLLVGPRARKKQDSPPVQRLAMETSSQTGWFEGKAAGYMAWLQRTANRNSLETLDDWIEALKPKLASPGWVSPQDGDW